MSGIATVMGIVLAAVLASAAFGKISAPAATTAEFAKLRIPAPRLLARLVPGVELIVAAGLILLPRYAGPVAALLLTVFTLVLIATVRSGRSVSCGCLGAMSRQPVTVITVARNLVFLAMAGAASAAPQPMLPNSPSTPDLPSVPDLPSIMVSATLILLALVVVQLLSLQQVIGRIWSVALAGESPGRTQRTPFTGGYGKEEAS